MFQIMCSFWFLLKFIESQNQFCMNESIFYCNLWRAVPEKINDFFEHKIFFLVQHYLVFVDMEYLFGATSTCFCQHQSTFYATSNFLFRYKIVFRAKPNFCFGHRLECYVMVIYFYCHVAKKINHVSNEKKKSFLC